MYYTTIDAANMKYYQLPKILFTSDLYKPLSNDAKIMYSLLKERLGASEKNRNRFTDKNGNIYFIYPVQTLSEIIGTSKTTTIKVKKELIDVGLLEEKRTGRSNLMYLLKPAITEGDLYRIEKDFEKVDEGKEEIERDDCGQFTSSSTQNSKKELIRNIGNTAIQPEVKKMNIRNPKVELSYIETNFIETKRDDDINNAHTHETPFFKYLDTFKIFSATDIKQIMFDLNKFACNPDQSMIEDQIKSMINQPIVAPVSYFLNVIRKRMTAKNLQREVSKLPAIDVSYNFASSNSSASIVATPQTIHGYI